MKYREIPGAIKDQVVLNNPDLAEIFTEFPDAEVSEEILLGLTNEYPDMGLSVSEDLLSGKQVAGKTITDADVTPTTTEEGFEQDFLTPRGSIAEQEAKSKSPTGVEVVVNTPAYKEVQKQAEDLTTNQPKGLIRYKLKAIDKNGTVVKSEAFLREQPLSKAQEDEVKEAWKMRQQIGGVGDGVTLELDKGLRTVETQELRKALADRAMSAGELLGEDYLEDLKTFQAMQPTAVKKAVMGEEPSVVGAVGDALSGAGRAGYATLSSLFGGNDFRESMAQSDVNPNANFGVQMAQGIAQDPTLLIGASLGRPMLQGLKATLPKSLGGKAITLTQGLRKSPWKTMGKEAVAGAGSSLADLAYRREGGTTMEGDESYLGTGLMGFGTAGGMSAVMGGAKHINRLGRKKGLGPIMGGYLDLKQGVGKALGSPDTVASAKASRIMKQAQGIGERDMEVVNKIAEDMGVAPGDLFPSIGLKNRNSLTGDDIVKLANKNPQFYDQWEQAYEGVVNLLDKQLNFKTALDPLEAGTEMVKAAELGKKKIFDENSRTYNAIVADAELAPKVGEALRLRVDDAIESLDERIAKLRDKQVTYSEEVVGKDSYYDAATGLYNLKPNQKTTTQTMLIEGISEEAEEELSESIERLTNFRAALNGLKNKANPQDLLRSVNNLRNNAQTQMSNIRPFGVPDKTNLAQKDIRDITRDLITNSVEDVNPAIYAELKSANENLTKLSKIEEIVGKALNKKDLEDPAKIFNIISKDAEKMSAFRDLVAPAIGNKNFEKFVDAYAKANVVRYASTGELSDKQANILKPNSKEMQFLRNYKPQVDLDKTKMYAEQLYTLSSPNRQGLGSAIKTSPKDQALLGKLMASPKVAIKSAMESASDKGETKAQTRLLKDLLVDQMEMVGDLGATPSGVSGKTGNILGQLGAEGLGLARAAGLYGGDNLFLSTLARPNNQTGTDGSAYESFKDKR